LSAAVRIQQLVDQDSFHPLPQPERPKNQLAFPDYTAKLTRATTSSGLTEAVVTGTATIATWPVVLIVMDSHFMMGTLNTAVTRRIIAAITVAQQQQRPVVLVTASGGARMQEGLYALVGMNLILAAVERLAATDLPLITVLTDPTMGGVSASFAFKGDVILAEAGAKIGFAGPRVIQQTMPVDLPADFQTAASLYTHGAVDAVIERPALRAKLATILEAYQCLGAGYHGWTVTTITSGWPN